MSESITNVSNYPQQGASAASRPSVIGVASGMKREAGTTRAKSGWVVVAA